MPRRNSSGAIVGGVAASETVARSKIANTTILPRFPVVRSVFCTAFYSAFRVKKKKLCSSPVKVKIRRRGYYFIKFWLTRVCLWWHPDTNPLKNAAQQMAFSHKFYRYWVYLINLMFVCGILSYTELIESWKRAIWKYNRFTRSLRGTMLDLLSADLFPLASRTKM